MSQRMDYNAASPAGAKALGALYAHVRQSGFPVRLIDVVYLRISQINGCAYCIDAHSRDLLKGGRTAGRASRPRLARSRRSLQRTGKGGARLGGSRHAPRRSRRFGRGIRSGVGCFQRGATRRADHRDRPDECLQPGGDQLPCDAARVVKYSGQQRSPSRAAP